MQCRDQIVRPAGSHYNLFTGCQYDPNPEPAARDVRLSIAHGPDAVTSIVTRRIVIDQIN